LRKYQPFKLLYAGGTFCQENFSKKEEKKKYFEVEGWNAVTGTKVKRKT